MCGRRTGLFAGIKLYAYLNLRHRCSCGPAATTSAGVRQFGSPSSSRLEQLQQRLAKEALQLHSPSSGVPFPPPATIEIERNSSSSTPTRNAKLVDRFGRVHRYLRISLSERCNLRCTYCMPREGTLLSCEDDLLSTKEILRVAEIAATAGVTKFRLTGGEPTLRKDLIDVVSELSRLNGVQTVAMTTNGVLLERLLPALQSAGLTHLNISLDTLKPARFEAVSRRSVAHWHRVWAGIQAAKVAGFAPLKINCVLMKGVNDDEMLDFVALTEQQSLQVRFIELMPFAGNGWSNAQFLSTREQIQTIRAAFPSFSRLEAQSSASFGARLELGLPVGSETASLWRVQGHVGTVGFISSMSNAFCGTCDRLRLTADGHVRACLHGREEQSVRDVLRSGGSDADVLAAIQKALDGKHASLGGNVSLKQLAGAAAAPDQRPMVKIGG